MFKHFANWEKKNGSTCGYVNYFRESKMFLPCAVSGQCWARCNFFHHPFVVSTVQNFVYVQ